MTNQYDRLIEDVEDAVKALARACDSLDAASERPPCAKLSLSSTLSRWSRQVGDVHNNLAVLLDVLNMANKGEPIPDSTLYDCGLMTVEQEQNYIPF